MAYYSTKTYGHNIGLSAVYSVNLMQIIHIVICYMVIVYSLNLHLVVTKLDNKNWAVDFGGLKPLKAWLEDNFDHKTCVDVNDPHKQDFYDLLDRDLCEVSRI